MIENVKAVVGKVTDAVSDLANVDIPRNLRTATASSMMGVAAIGGVGAATSSADGSLVRDPYGVWDPYARAQGQNYLAGGPALQGGGAVALRIRGADANGVYGTRNTSAIFLGNYHDSQQGGLRSLFVTAEHNIADFYTAFDVTSSVRTGSNFNSDPGAVVNVNRWIQGNLSESRNPNARDYAFFWGDTVVNGNNAVFGTSAVGSIIALTSFGDTGSEQQGNLGQDGNVRTVFSLMDASLTSGFNSSIFRQGEVSPDMQLDGAGRQKGRSSGGLVSNDQGEIIGHIIAGTNGWGFDGVTIFQSYNDPVFLEQFNSITVPAPGAISLVGLAAMVGSRRRRS